MKINSSNNYNQTPTSKTPDQNLGRLLKGDIHNRDSRDIVSRCLAFLDHRDVLRASPTNRFMHEISKFDSIWSAIEQQRLLPISHSTPEYRNLTASHSLIEPNVLKPSEVIINHEKLLSRLPQQLSRTASIISAHAISAPLALDGAAWANFDPIERLTVFILDRNNTLQVFDNHQLLSHIEPEEDRDRIQVHALCSTGDSASPGLSFFAALSDNTLALFNVAHYLTNRQPLPANANFTEQPAVYALSNIETNSITHMGCLDHDQTKSLLTVVDYTELKLCEITKSSIITNRNAVTPIPLLEASALYKCTDNRYIESMITVANKHVVLGLNDGSLVVITPDDTDTPTVTTTACRGDRSTWNVNDRINHLATFNDRYFVSSQENGDVHLWDINNPHQPRKSGYTSSPIGAITFDRERHLMISGHENGRLILWDLGGTGSTLEPRTFSAQPHHHRINFVHYVDQELITASPSEHGIKRWTFNAVN